MPRMRVPCFGCQTPLLFDEHDLGFSCPQCGIRYVVENQAGVLTLVTTGKVKPEVVAAEPEVVMDAEPAGAPSRPAVVTSDPVAGATPEPARDVVSEPIAVTSEPVAVLPEAEPVVVLTEAEPVVVVTEAEAVVVAKPAESVVLVKPPSRGPLIASVLTIGMVIGLCGGVVGGLGLAAVLYATLIRPG
ncbi:MAG: hypothetical protein U0556_18225 [Dehalococcoidia bacterium]